MVVSPAALPVGDAVDVDVVDVDLELSGSRCDDEAAATAAAEAEGCCDCCCCCCWRDDDEEGGGGVG